VVEKNTKKKRTEQKNVTETEKEKNKKKVTAETSQVTKPSQTNVEGNFLKDPDTDLTHLNYVRDGKSVTVTFNKEKRVFFKSGLKYGKIVIHQGNAYSSICLMVHLGELVDAARERLSELLDCQVSFYTKHQTLNVGCFIDTHKNLNLDQCVRAIENGKPKLLPVSELNERVCKFYAVLKAGPVKQIDQKYVWGLTVFELNIQDIDESDPEYQRIFEPTILFADK
jgi:hypothetical protein